MNLLDSLLSRLGYVKARVPIPEWLGQEARASRYAAYETAATVQRQADLYSKLTWIATAIDTVAESCAPVPYHVKERRGEETVDIPNHDFERLLANPNPLQSRYEFQRDIFSYYGLTGNGIIWKNRESEQAPPDELWVMPSQYVKPVPDEKMYLKGYTFDTGTGQPIPLETWEICHIKTFNPIHPFWGLSAVQQLYTVGRGDLAQQAWNANLFGEDNAKIPGALAFASMISNPDWERLKAETRENWGGARRKGPLMLRGTGAGGVNWVQMALSQKEMEFIESRKFTKEEVHGKLAPGLASILDVNATEANAIAGKSVFLEFALWPRLSAVGAKMSKDILSAYGENLVGEYDDVRQSNRLLDLQEQQEYSKVHTVDEIRQEYYEGDPLPEGDPRGAMFPAQIGQSTRTEEPEAQMPAEQGMVPVERPEPVETEMKAWERWALKRLGKANGREFEPRAIPIFQAARIRARLAQAKTAEDVGRAFALERSDSAADNLLAELARAREVAERLIA